MASGWSEKKKVSDLVEERREWEVCFGGERVLVSSLKRERKSGFLVVGMN